MAWLILGTTKPKSPVAKITLEIIFPNLKIAVLFFILGSIFAKGSRSVSLPTSMSRFSSLNSFLPMKSPILLRPFTPQS